MVVRGRETKRSVEDLYLFYRCIVGELPILLMKRLLTVYTIPVGSGRGLYGIIPKLALLPPTNLFGSELGSFQGRG